MGIVEKRKKEKKKKEMIEKLQIRNFRLHKKIDIEFAPDITSIIGSSFTGKSTLIKALKWIALNKPAGDSMIRWFTDKVSVRLIVDDNKIIRHKGKGGNLYIFEEDEFRAFGNDVPEVISKILNLSDINFQGQFVRHFWFSETAGEVSRQLNRIVNLEVIDSTLANIASELRTTRSTIAVIETRLTNIKEKEKKLDYVKELDEDLKDLESIHKRYNDIIKESTLLQETINLVSEHRLIRDNAREYVSEGLIIAVKGEIYQKTSEKANSLQKLIKDGKSYMDISRAIPPSLKPLERLNSKIQALQKRREDLSSLFGQAEDWEEVLFQANFELKRAQKEFKDKMGKECPLCGNRIKK